MAESGRFYFKQTANKNLLGEFSNHGTKRNYTESADVEGCIVSYKERFIGKYISTYREDSTVYIMNLYIKYRDKTENSIFTLTWIDVKNEFAFVGEAFLVDDILIGDYKSIPIKDVNRP